MAGGVEVLGVKIVWTAEKIDNFFNPPVGGARAKLGNQLVYYIKLKFSLSVCLYPPFFSTRSSDRNQIWHTYSGKYGTHSELKKITHPTPEGSHGGVGGFLGGQKIKSPGNVMNCLENQ